MFGQNNLISPYYQPSSFEGSAVWTIVSFVVALIGCFVVYFWFVKSKNDPKEKFLIWLKGFLNFDEMLIEAILKIAYIFTCIFITLSSFSLISISFVTFLLTLVGGNILARIVYESCMIMLMIWKNTTEIKKKMK